MSACAQIYGVLKEQEVEEMQADYVKQQEALHPQLHDTIVHLKSAIYKELGGPRASVSLPRLPGYYIELLCINHFNQLSESPRALMPFIFLAPLVTQVIKCMTTASTV